MLYTSGTTGNPKGVPLTDRNAGVNGLDWLRCNGPLLQEGAVDLLWLPTSHIFGFGAASIGNTLAFTSYLSDPRSVLVLGVIYTLKKNDDGQLDGPVNKRAIATFSTHRALFEWLYAEAVKRGYGTDKFERVHFLADGADAIWALQREFFPDAEVELDWYHVSEKLWAAGKCLHRKNRPKVEAWVVPQKKRLRSGSFDALMTELRVAVEDTPLTGPGNKYRRTLLAAVINHFDKNRDRMKYARLRRLDLDITTGVVEGAVRHIIGTRFDRPGMRWGLDHPDRDRPPGEQWSARLR